MYIVLLFALMLGGANGEPKQFKLEAETWINAPVLRFPDDRTYAVLYFSSPTSREEAEKLEGLLEKLEKVARRKDYFVLLLSPEKEDAVRRFVRKGKIELPVGAGSNSHRQFKIEIEQFPQLIILERATSKTAIWEAFPSERIDSLVPPESNDGLVSGGFDASSSTDELTRYASEDPDEEQRERAVELLRGRMPTEEFLKMCDALLADRDPVDLAYGRIDYQRHLADPSITEKQPRLADSALASQARRENPTEPRWARLNEYEQTLSGKTLNQLWTDYESSMTNDPVDLLIRRSIVDDLANCTDKVGARSLLMRMMPIETDFAVRLRVVGSLRNVCEPGDLEAADFLEAQLAHETNIRNVRPFMGRTIRYLRTGE